ncbi:MAG: hypothetical protein JWR30_818, partial [Conexibacter sp.]|nr:hypothetical protein [Conexibacter sp.]
MTEERNERELRQEQSLVDLEQVLGDRGQLLGDRDQARIDHDQVRLDTDREHDDSEGSDAALMFDERQSRLDRTQATEDAQQEALDHSQTGRDGHQDAIDEQRAVHELPEADQPKPVDATKLQRDARD